MISSFFKELFNRVNQGRWPYLIVIGTYTGRYAAGLYPAAIQSRFSGSYDLVFIALFFQHQHAL